MKAVVLHGPKDVSIGDMPIPEMKSNYVYDNDTYYCGVYGKREREKIQPIIKNRRAIYVIFLTEKSQHYRFASQ